MAFVSASYGASDPTVPEGSPKQIVAFDDQGNQWAFTEDYDSTDWLTYLNEGGTIDPYVAPPINGDQVNIERDRRITGGFDYMGHRFQSDEFSQRNIMDAAQSAGQAIADGATADDYRWQAGAIEDYYWIVEDNAKLPMTAYDVRGLAQTMLRFKQRMIGNGRALKDLDPIPVDYIDDRYWPFEPPPAI
jgi:hypothetical protein